MLWIIFSKVNPSIRVGISALKTSLSTATRPTFKRNVIVLLHFMHENYVVIYENYGVHTDYTLNLSTALETVHNNEFLSFLHKEKYKWETRTIQRTDKETSKALCKKGMGKYNNINPANRWKKSEDPCAKVISALVT